MTSRATLFVIGCTLIAYSIAAHHANRIAQIQLQQHIHQIETAQ